MPLLYDFMYFLSMDFTKKRKFPPPASVKNVSVEETKTSPASYFLLFYMLNAIK